MKFTVLCAVFLPLCWQTAISQTKAPADQPIEWDMPRLRFHAAVEYFSRTASAEVAQRDFGCQDALVGPIKGRMTPDEFWQELTHAVGVQPRMLGTKERPVYASQRVPIPGLPPEEINYDLPRDKLHENIHRIAEITRTKTGRTLLIAYLGSRPEDDDILVGPLNVFTTPHEALLRLIDQVPALTIRRVDKDMLSVEPRAGVPRKSDLRTILAVQCKPNRTQPPFESVMVERSRLPPLEGDSVIVFDRRRIEETGAPSIPDLLRYISQTSFWRPPGYRASGAQFAELRGLGAEYTLILINGRRALASASELAVEAFDISAVPISAVERLEISPDATSIIHGVDAIGGVVNVVLKDRTIPTLEARYGGARGGGEVIQTALSVGGEDSNGHFAIVADLFQQRELLGRERDRWNNQDYRRFAAPEHGGIDYRSRMSNPPNVRTLDGSNLPGLSTPVAALSFDDPASGLTVRPGEVNLTSLRAYQAIVPNSMRASVAADGRWAIGSTTISTDVLAIKRTNDLQLVPNTIAGYVWAADHPENPFHVPVALEAALVPWPALQQHSETRLVRAAAALDGAIGGGKWNYSAFVLRSDEDAKAWLRNSIDSSAIQSGLLADTAALSVIGMMTKQVAPPFTDSPVRRTYVGGTQLSAMARGPLLEIAGDPVMASLGIEHRHETLRFTDQAGGGANNRDITSAYTHVTIPLVTDSIRIPLVEQARVGLGGRLDDYSGSQRVTNGQYNLEWLALPALKFHATVSESFRPPSLLDMHLPQITVPTEIFDPKRAELTRVVVRVGGNPALRATTGRSRTFGVAVDAGNDLLISATYWQTRMRDRVTPVPPFWLLAAEDTRLSQRIVRAPPTPEDQAAGRPGRLVLLDSRQANVGAADIAGFDLSAQATVRTRFGIFEPRLTITATDRFKCGELPTNAPVPDRAGVASVHGTIPNERGIASINFERDHWRVNVQVRALSAYKDWNPTEGVLTGHTVPASTVWDANVSRHIGDINVTLGAFNLTDVEPPFSALGGSTGIDLSQGDLRQREIYLAISGEF